MKKVVLITGVSSGFGKQIAELFAASGYTVYGTSRKAISAESSLHLLKMDVTDVDSINNGVASVLQAEGRIDVLINNAGMGISGAIEDTSTAEAKIQMDTTFYGMFHTMQAVLPGMRKQGSGTIINISSIGGLMGLPFQGFYAASKFAIEGLTHSLRMELKPFGIKVILINPGDFNTHFTANRQMVAKSGAGSAYEAQFKKTLAIIEKDENGGLDPAILAKKVLSIVEKKNPCVRYVISSAEQKLAVVLKNLLPDSWFYKMIADHYGIK